MPATLYSDHASDVLSTSDLESGYVSGRSSQCSNSLGIHFTNPHLVFLNRQLQNLNPQGSLSLVRQTPKGMSDPVAWQKYYNGASPPFRLCSRPPHSVLPDS